MGAFIIHERAQRGMPRRYAGAAVMRFPQQLRRRLEPADQHVDQVLAASRPQAILPQHLRELRAASGG